MTHHDPTPRPCIEITVVEVKGSAPREAGARMFWFPDERIEGTIGGGKLEHQSLEEAKTLWEDSERTTALLEYPLSAKLGQCCGGLVRLFLNKRIPEKRVHICGAGHVATGLAAGLPDSPRRGPVNHHWPARIVLQYARLRPARYRAQRPGVSSDLVRKFLEGARCYRKTFHAVQSCSVHKPNSR